MEALERELGAFEQAIASGTAADTVAQIGFLSEELVKAVRRPRFPAYQIPRWVWVASQYRLHQDDKGGLIRSRSAAALTFLSSRLAAAEVADHVVQDLNWVLDSTIRTLSQFAGDRSAQLPQRGRSAPDRS